MSNNTEYENRNDSNKLDNENETINKLESKICKFYSENSTNETEEHSSVVAAHYNHLKEKGLTERFNSPIFYLRNFNNWVKSVLIQEYISDLRSKNYGRPLKVLDICCGKGGDIAKWQKARVHHVVFADIAEISIQQCKSRYEDFSKKCRNTFTAEFLVADCSRISLKERLQDPSIKFDLVSCQFGLHYSFESLPQARQMLSNVSSSLCTDGYFIGTIPNAYKIVSKFQNATNFGNRIYSINLLGDKNNYYPLFGAKYDFQLEGVVDCPEFLVNIKLLEMLALEYGLELLYKASFADFFKEYEEKYKSLLSRIMCFETYPPPPGKNLTGDEMEYLHAKVFIDKQEKSAHKIKIGTMSACEWEVATLYMVFVFKKLPHTWDSEGKIQYIINKSTKDKQTDN